MLRYSLLRIALVLAAGGVLYLLGLRSWLLAVLAIAVGAMLGYILLPSQRDKAVESFAGINRKVREREDVPTDDEAAEDAAVQAAVERVEGPDSQR